jgi:hypothetical protein
MNRLVMPVAALSAVVAFAATSAAAQTAKDLVGTWTLVSTVAEQNGSKIDTLGPSPIGTALFGSDGHYAVILFRRDLPKIASGRRTSETPDEALAIAEGSVAHFGTYEVTGKTLVMHIESSTFTNWNGTEQRRPFSLVGDELIYTSPGATGMSTETTMRRAR